MIHLKIAEIIVAVESAEVVLWLAVVSSLEAVLWLEVVSSLEEQIFWEAQRFRTLVL